jgi:hypothetical protein
VSDVIAEPNWVRFKFAIVQWPQLANIYPQTREDEKTPIIFS